MLTKKELERYSRQIIISGFGKSGQEKLKKATVFIAGAGGLSSSCSMYLAAAGVGHIKICDFDKTVLSNLNRQILHGESKIGINKAVSAKITLQKINQDIKIEAIEEKITENNVCRLVGNSQIIVDCMDNFPTRFILNKCSKIKKIPLVHGSILGLEGRLTFIKIPETPCLKCIYFYSPPKKIFPVLGAAPGIIGCLQAMETIKYIVGLGENIKGRLLIFDGKNMSFSETQILKNPKCPVCSKK
ncbi:MAG: adenylyltransferase [Elusimicrobia bacterium HGW-Elusimicrobia-4]|nr:MAG: adenylyltransferase [Elusimicrobia bacterium HGW-Elusimicrobia-4]